MKTSIIAAFAAVTAIACQGAFAETEAPETVLFANYNMLSPAQGEDWDDASGFEVQGRFWHGGHVGFALAAGSDTWAAQKTVSEIDDGSVYSYSSIDGDATVTTLGASLLYRSSAMFIELGLRFAFIDSSVYAEAIYEDDSGSDYLREVIEIENTTFFVARMGVELEMTEDVFLVPSIGYQVDLGRPSETWAGEPLGETDFRAVTFGIGITCRL
jgi:hypothetical protein